MLIFGGRCAGGLYFRLRRHSVCETKADEDANRVVHRIDRAGAARGGEISIFAQLQIWRRAIGSRRSLGREFRSETIAGVIFGLVAPFGTLLA